MPKWQIKKSEVDGNANRTKILENTKEVHYIDLSFISYFYLHKQMLKEE